MSFASPIWLLALALVPVALAAYDPRSAPGERATRSASPRSRRCARRCGTAPSWERHLPAAFALAAMALLAIALARPRVTYRVAVGEASMMLVTDHSGSMAANDVQPTRLAAAQCAPPTPSSTSCRASVRVGAIGFSSSPDAAQAPVANHAAARAIIDATVG